MACSGARALRAVRGMFLLTDSPRGDHTCILPSLRHLRRGLGNPGWGTPFHTGLYDILDFTGWGSTVALEGVWRAVVRARSGRCGGCFS